MSQSLKKISVYLFALRLLRMAMSIVTVVLSAKYFGISVERDIWVLVTAFLVTIDLAVWGPINETFRTKFVYLREQEGENVALAKTASLLSFVVWGTLIISLMIYLFPEQLMSWIAPSVAEMQKGIFVRMLYLLIPTFLINELITIGTSILNAYESFYVPEVVNFFSGVFNIFCLLFLAPLIGIDSLIVSTYLSIILLLIILMYYVHRKNICIKYRLFSFSWKDIKPFVLFSIPFFIPYFVSQCNSILEKSLSNLLGEGVVSILDYARRFTDVLLSVLLSVLSAVLVPVLSKHFSSNNMSDFVHVFKEYIQIITLILSLTLPVLIGAALPLDTFFYFRGEITMDIVRQIALLTQLYGVAFIAVAFYLFFGVSLLAQNQGKVYAVYGAVAQLIMIMIDLSFYKVWGIYTFVIALFSSHSLMGLMMFRKLKLRGKHLISFYLIKCISILILLILIQLLVSFWIPDVHVMLQLIMHGCVLLITLPLLTWIFGFNLKHYIVLLKERVIRR